MVDKRNVVVRAIETSLQVDGWRKARASWYKKGIDTLLVVDLQKSNYSRSYYLNLGIFVAPVPEGNPGSEVAPIRLRVEDLPGARYYEPRKLLDLENALDDGERERRLTEMMRDLVLKNMNNCMSVAALEPRGAGRSVVDSVPLLGRAAMFLRVNANQPGSWQPPQSMTRHALE